jgi:hypothetical protein
VTPPWRPCGPSFDRSHDLTQLLPQSAEVAVVDAAALETVLMLLAHAVLVAEARSYLAALADNAPTRGCSREYERVLLPLDELHGGAVPATTEVPSTDSAVLYEVARAAITNLETHGDDVLDVELCLAMLDAAHALDDRA